MAPVLEGRGRSRRGLASETPAEGQHPGAELLALEVVHQLVGQLVLGGLQAA